MTIRNVHPRPQRAQSRRNIGGPLDFNALSQLYGCRGCGRVSRDSACRDCRHTDRNHGTRVLAPGEVCPVCGAEVLG